MNEIRPLIHEVLNALAIAKGLCENVQSSYTGELQLTQEQISDKLKRAIRAMDRIEATTMEIRSQVVHMEKKGD